MRTSIHNSSQAAPGSAPRALSVCLIHARGHVACGAVGHSGSEGGLGSRRDLLVRFGAAGMLAISGTSIAGAVSPAAHAGPLGQQIAAAWRRTQQANSSKIIAPIKVAQQRLMQASTFLDNAAAAATTPTSAAAIVSGSSGAATAAADSEAGVVSALQAVRASSLNCYVFDAFESDTVETKASLVTQQLQLADPCKCSVVCSLLHGVKCHTPVVAVMMMTLHQLQHGRQDNHNIKLA
jgi:hypothetical protein